MTIRHHLSDQLLMAYSAGQLPEAFSLVVATHISLCDECRARMSAFDSVGGAIVERCGTAEMRPGSFAAVMARLDRTAAPSRRPAAPAPQGPLLAPLRDYVGDSLESVKWRAVGPGVKQAILQTDKQASVRLLRIAAGQAVPDHGHQGMELTLVLQGAFRDGTDRFGPGDLEIADAELQHTPVAEEGADCICLAATDAPLRFNGIIQRIAQPFFRI